MDVWTVNLRRTHAWQNNDRYLEDRVVETLGIGYQDHWPFRQAESARGVKKSVLHDRVAAAGACFGESAGWERPNWYARPGQAPVLHYGWGRQNWFANNAEEHRAVRERVGLFEQSSFAKLMVVGRDAVKVLNRIATANVDVAVGRCVYTQFLNAAAGIEADLTVTRLAPDRFLVVTAAFTQTHVEAWIRNSISADSFCAVVDVSDAYAMLNVQGPSSRALLQELSSDDFSAGAFPFATCREMQDRISDAPGAAADLRRRARLGAVRSHFFRAAGVRRVDRGRRGAWPASLRLSHAQFAAHREGLSRLAARHRPGGHAIGGGPCLHLRLEQARRLHRSRRARAPQASRGPEAPAGAVPAGRIRSRCSITTSRSIGTASASASSPPACTDIRSARRWRSAT